MGAGIGFAVALLFCLVPLALVAYLFSTLHVIVQGLRSVNAQLTRISTQLEARESRERNSL
jgi:hypothetical protein